MIFFSLFSIPSWGLLLLSSFISCSYHTSIIVQQNHIEMKPAFLQVFEVWKFPDTSSKGSPEQLLWKMGYPAQRRHWNSATKHTGSHWQSSVVLFLVRHLLSWVERIQAMAGVTSYFNRQKPKPHLRLWFKVSNLVKS